MCLYGHLSVLPLTPSPTCVLSELVHGLQVDDVRRELAIHLPQSDTPPGIPLQHILNMMTNRRTVGPPAPMLVKPLPDHHPGHVLRGVPQPIDRQQPRSWTSHLPCDSADTLERFHQRQAVKEESWNQRLVWWPPPPPSQLSHAALKQTALLESSSTGDWLLPLWSAQSSVCPLASSPVWSGSRWRWWWLKSGSRITSAAVAVSWISSR